MNQVWQGLSFPMDKRPLNQAVELSMTRRWHRWQSCWDHTGRISKIAIAGWTDWQKGLPKIEFLDCEPKNMSTRFLVSCLFQRPPSMNRPQMFLGRKRSQNIMQQTSNSNRNPSAMWLPRNGWCQSSPVGGLLFGLHQRGGRSGSRRRIGW